MPKLIFLDIDGTLLLPGHPMSQRVAQALRRAKQNGHKLFLCTGRSRVMLPAELTAFGFDGIVCSAGGYVTLGDTMVLLSAYLLGPVYGALAAGIGSALADLLNGFPAWVPATLVIKAVMALVAALVYKKLGHKFSGLLVCGVIGEIPMVVGYWLFESWMMNSFSGAAVGIPANMVQAMFGLVAATLLAAALQKSGYVRREFPEFV